MVRSGCERYENCNLEFSVVGGEIFSFSRGILGFLFIGL